MLCEDGLITAKLGCVVNISQLCNEISPPILLYEACWIVPQMTRLDKQRHESAYICFLTIMVFHGVFMVFHHAHANVVTY